ncbi:hypothetical protein LTR22_024856 [Elasticomyces elasticus]|nr:hypothetical protein LTR22_024856 [Elasticomyces elasticus]KAK4906014.1 hypothetical protein LTR49_024777 [Elasticomyces elasticus]
MKAWSWVDDEYFGGSSRFVEGGWWDIVRQEEPLHYDRWICDKSSKKSPSLCRATVESWPKSGEVNLVGASMINEGIKWKMVELNYFSAWEE